MAVYRKALQCFHERLAGEALSNLAGVVGHWIPAEQRTRLRHSGERKPFGRSKPHATAGTRPRSLRAPALTARPEPDCPNPSCKRSGRPSPANWPTLPPPSCSGGDYGLRSSTEPPSACPTPPPTRRSGLNPPRRNPAADSPSSSWSASSPCPQVPSVPWPTARFTTPNKRFSFNYGAP